MEQTSIETYRRILSELANTAEHASLTRSLGGGEKAAARAFNGALAALTDAGLAPGGMFESMNVESADYGSLGMQARLLLACLEEPSRGKRKERGGRGEESLDAVVALAPFLSSDDLAQMLHERIDETSVVPDELLTALAPFLESSALGQLVRRRMRPKTPPAPPVPPIPTEPPTPSPYPIAGERETLREVVRHEPTSPATIGTPATLESLAAELRRPDLTVEERQGIAMRLADLSYEQSIKALD